MLDLRPATIRTWEARYNQIVPARSEGGQRLYSRELVERLRFVRDRVAAGSRPADAHRLLADRLANGQRPRAAARLRVLLAERRLGAADALSRLFGGGDCEVVPAKDGASARSLYAKLSPALVVVD